MRQGSLVELAELINETYCIALLPVSILTSVLIRNAASFFLFFKSSVHLLVFLGPEHDLITASSETKATCTVHLRGAP